jgi:hypothetical protein
VVVNLFFGGAQGEKQKAREQGLPEASDKGDHPNAF